MKKAIFTFLIVALCGIVLSGCSKDDENPFVGTWNGVDTDGDKITLVITNSTWVAAWPDLSSFGPFTGTYTHSGDNATFSFAGEGEVGTAIVSGKSMTGIIDGLGFTVTK
jgi:uncharacterized lipoprotein NlpE involved in copper resistance